MSNNFIALSEGRITQAQFDDMAAYKFITYGNWEDLDVDKDYTKYGIIKCYPIISFYGGGNDRIIASPRGLVRFMMDKCGITDYDLSDVSDKCDYDCNVSFTHRNYGWTWINDNGYDGDKLKDIIKYTYGNNHPIADYISDYHQMWE